MLIDALALQDAGAFSLVLESIPADVARTVTRELAFRPLALARARTAMGQILVSYDMLGLFDGFVPSFVQQHAKLGDAVVAATREHVATCGRPISAAHESGRHTRCRRRDRNLGSMSAEVAETIARVRAWRDDRRRAGNGGVRADDGCAARGSRAADRNRAQRGDHVVVSIFVNPLQFDRTDDLERYPRTLDADLRICNDRGVEVVFAPTVQRDVSVEPLCTVTVKRITDRLCGQFRPGTSMVSRPS